MVIKPPKARSAAECLTPGAAAEHRPGAGRRPAPDRHPAPGRAARPGRLSRSTERCARRPACARIRACSTPSSPSPTSCAAPRPRRGGRTPPQRKATFGARLEARPPPRRAAGNWQVAARAYSHLRTRRTGAMVSSPLFRGARPMPALAPFSVCSARFAPSTHAEGTGIALGEPAAARPAVRTVAWRPAARRAHARRRARRRPARFRRGARRRPHTGGAERPLAHRRRPLAARAAGTCARRSSACVACRHDQAEAAGRHGRARPALPSTRRRS